MRLVYTVIFLFCLFVCGPSYAAFPMKKDSSQVEDVSGYKPGENKKINKLRVKSRMKNWLKTQSDWSIASLICGICGLIVAGIPLGICAIIFGAIGYGKGKPGLATAGMILGFFDIALLLIFVL